MKEIRVASGLFSELQDRCEYKIKSVLTFVESDEQVSGDSSNITNWLFRIFPLLLSCIKIWPLT